jgi:hypothetical protein
MFWLFKKIKIIKSLWINMSYFDMDFESNSELSLLIIFFINKLI